MAVLKMPDIRKLSPADAQKKLSEMERLLLELMGEGKVDRVRPVKKAIARLKTFLHENVLKSKLLQPAVPSPPKKPRAVKSNRSNAIKGKGHRAMKKVK